MIRFSAAERRPATGDELYELLFQVAGVAQMLRAATEAALAGTGIGLPTRGLMEVLDEGGARAVPRLAATLGVTRQAVQPLVDALVAAGRAELLPNPASRRSPLVRLTQEGSQVFDALRGHEMRYVWDVAATLSMGEVAVARDTLTRLATAVAALDIGRAP